MNSEVLAQMRLAALELASKTCYGGSSEDVMQVASRYEAFIINGKPPRIGLQTVGEGAGIASPS